MKIKRIYIGILFLIFLSCQKGLKKFDCQKIDYINIYFVPFDIMSPIEFTKEHIKLELHKKTISDKDRIENICDRTLLIKKSEDVNFMNGKVHLRADFIRNEKEILTVLSDGNTFKIGRKLYEWDEDLIDLLIQDYYMK